MNYLRFSFFIFLFSVFRLSSLFAQKLDSIQKLDEVTISSSKIQQFNVGNQVITIDSVTKSIYNTYYLNSVINELSSLNLRSNGLGLSTISARGTGNSHTPVLWNNFNMEDITGLGVDMSLLPSMFFDNIAVQLGGSSALFGSGAIGGSVHLTNKPFFNQPLKVKLGSSIGSFGNYFENLGVNWGNSFYSTSLKMFYNKAKNNFPYSGTYKTTTKDYFIDTTQTNAGIKQAGLMSNNYFKFSDNQNLNINVWVQKADKNIAPSLGKIVDGPIDTLKQVNNDFRGSAEYSILLGKLDIRARTGFFQSNMEYTQNTVPELTKCMLSISEIDGTYLPNNYLKFYGGMNYSYEEANSPIYSDIKTRKRIALFSSIKVNNENSQAVLNIRTERVDNTFIPVTFSFGINQSYFKNTFIIHANVSKNYKLPSFNDLYYSWGGNPDLKPENGLNYEGGISYNFSNSAGDFKYNSTLFHSDMENWIKWAEVTPWVWQPQNVDKVKMDGLDNSLEYKKSISKFTLGLKGMYTYIDAINVNTDSKLTYTPEHKITGIITAFYGPLMIRFSEQYQSQVTYERSGTLNSLPGVELSNIAFSYSLSIKTTMVKATAQINNLFNKDYMYVADYPMPQRNFQVGVQFEF